MSSSEDSADWWAEHDQALEDAYDDNLHDPDLEAQQLREDWAHELEARRAAGEEI